MNPLGYLVLLGPIPMIGALIWGAVACYPAWYGIAMGGTAVVVGLVWFFGFVGPIMGAMNSDI